jgi:transaldolase
MQTLLNRLDSSTRLLVASVRSAADISQLGQAGLDTYTFSAAVAAELFNQRETLADVAVFEAHAAGKT